MMRSHNKLADFAEIEIASEVKPEKSILKFF